MHASAAGSVRWLRAEGLAVLLLSLALFAEHGQGWALFAALLLAPDLAMLGYLGGPRIGARAYNLAHTYTAPLLLAAAAVVVPQPLLASLALIWCAHIGLDRALGYGLKLPGGFRDTHLGRIGRSPAPVPPVAATAPSTRRSGAGDAPAPV